MTPAQSSVSENLLREIQQHFPNQALTTITDALNLYGVEPFERERERVQLAILKLSKGDLDQLWYYLDRAKQDYRDVLYWAEYYPTSPASSQND